MIEKNPTYLELKVKFFLKGEGKLTFSLKKDDKWVSQGRNPSLAMKVDRPYKTNSMVVVEL